VSRLSWWIGMIIGFTFVKGNKLKINRIIPIMKILKFPYLNLNICKEVQIFWEIMLLDRV
jgi:hypothetical protein